jgi:hypothetical protein
MLRRIAVWVVMALGTQGSLALQAHGQTESATPVGNTPGAASYPETTNGLKALLQDIFAAEKAGDAAKSTPLYESLAIPDHATWFTKIFGSSEGARLEAKYGASSEEDLSRIKKFAQTALQEKRTFLNVRVFQKPEDTSTGLTKAFLSAMTSPVSIFDVTSTIGPDDKSPYAFGDFVYTNGGFRYLDINVMRALSTAPPIRVRIGGTVQNAKLVNRVAPLYPQASRQTTCKASSSCTWFWRATGASVKYRC